MARYEVKLVKTKFSRVSVGCDLIRRDLRVLTAMDWVFQGMRIKFCNAQKDMIVRVSYLRPAVTDDGGCHGYPTILEYGPFRGRKFSKLASNVDSIATDHSARCTCC